MVAEQHRACAGLIGKHPGARDGGGQRGALIDEGVAIAPRAVEHGVADRTGARGVAIGNHHGADAGVTDVGCRKPAKRCCRQQALALSRASRVDECLHRLLVGVHAQRLREQGALAERHHRLHFAREHAHQDRTGQRPRLVHVDVRIGLVAGEDVAVANQRFADVGVQVERDGDRRVRRDTAHFFQQGAFAVVGAIGHHHRAVQIEHDGIATARDGIADALAETIPGLAIDRTAGRCETGDRRDDLRAGVERHVDEPADRRAGAAHRRQRGNAEIRAVAAESLPRCGHRRERVGLVLHLGND